MGPDGLPILAYAPALDFWLVASDGLNSHTEAGTVALPSSICGSPNRELMEKRSQDYV